MNHIMLDLETLGKRSDACIVSIGAAQFDINTGDIGETFYCNVNPESSMYYGGTVDGSTIMWWMNQSDEARNQLQKKPIALKPALEAFNKFYGSCGGKCKVWGNGCTFDNVILSNAFYKTFIREPWPYNADMDMRTIVALGDSLLGIKVRDFKREGTYHNALDDAKFQAKVVSTIFMKLKEKC